MQARRNASTPIKSSRGLFEENFLVAAGVSRLQFQPEKNERIHIRCYGCNRRKYKFPGGDGMVRLLFVRSSEMG